MKAHVVPLAQRGGAGTQLVVGLGRVPTQRLGRNTRDLGERGIGHQAANGEQRAANHEVVEMNHTGFQAQVGELGRSSSSSDDSRAASRCASGSAYEP